MKRIHETFSEREHKQLSHQKESLRKELGISKLRWRDYILAIAGVKSIDKIKRSQ